MKISTRLGMGIGILVILIAYTVGQAVWHSGRIDKAFEDVERMARNRHAVDRLVNEIFHARVDMLGGLLVKDMQRLKQAEERIAQTKDIISYLNDNVRNEKRKAYIASIQRLIDAYKRPMKDIIELVRSAKADSNALLRSNIETTKEIGQQISRVGDQIMETYNESMEVMIKDYKALTFYVFINSLVAGVLAIGAALWVSLKTFRSVAPPIVEMTHAMGALAEGNLAVTVPCLARSDELGDMARAVQVFKDKALQMEKLVAEREEIRAKAASDRKEALRQMKAEFEASLRNVEEIVAPFKGASQEGIGERAAEAAKMAEIASEKAERTKDVIRILSRAVDKISDVVILINDISSQSEMLALSARVEAEYGGDNEGFSLASRANVLASQTARATWEIGDQVKAIQEETSRAVEAIKDVGQVIHELRGVSASLASSVGRQDETLPDATA